MDSQMALASTGRIIVHRREQRNDRSRAQLALVTGSSAIGHLHDTTQLERAEEGQQGGAGRRVELVEP